MCVILVLFISSTRKKRRKHLKEQSEVFERMNRRSPKNKVMSSENIGSSSAQQLMCTRPIGDVRRFFISLLLNKKRSA